MIMRFAKFFPLALCALSVAAAPLERKDSYTIESVAFPKDVPPEVGALGFNDAGELVVALRRSDILVAKPTADARKFSWRRFAMGLHNACGMQVVSAREVVVSQMAELTRIVDTDGDGVADLYENLCSDWGLSGNYHETAHLAPDGRGGWFVAPGTASHNGPVFYNIRGEYSKIGRRGRNYSSASYRGWVVHVDAKGKMTPWCSGFPMHNGILLDSAGNLWAGDNQGDWKAATPFYHLKRGGFYGHPSSLIWGDDWPVGQDPLLLPLQKINEMKTPPAVQLPHDIMCRSAGEPIEIPRDSFGPYGGQILVPDVAGKRICRLMLEEVDGQWQGGVTQFFDGNGLRSGNNRLCFSPDGATLYVGQTMRGWGKLAEGLQRIAWRGQPPFDVHTMSLTGKGFRLKFTRPVSMTDARFEAQTYHYEDTSAYGGPKLGVTTITPSAVKSTAPDVIELEIPGLKAGGQVYELKIDLKSADGDELWNDTFCYTVNRLRAP